MPTYSIRVWHGESNSLFYVIAQYSDDESDWGIVASFLTRKLAETYIKQLEIKP